MSFDVPSQTGANASLRFAILQNKQNQAGNRSDNNMSLFGEGVVVVVVVVVGEESRRDVGTLESWGR